MKGQNQVPSNQGRICPWWLCFTFDNVFRRLVQNPHRILSPYIKKGWTVLDVGPGMGYFTIPLAQMVGDSGKVIAADLQSKMLDAVYQRAEKAGGEKRILLHRSTPESIGIQETVDFGLAFWMVHEVPDRPRFIGELSSIIKPDGLLLLVEPKLHVSRENFAETLKSAQSTGLTLINQPGIFISNSALMRKTR
jgi:ubiquinone/menaquinone biosynthesis C-methylase UbiE